MYLSSNLSVKIVVISVSYGIPNVKILLLFAHTETATGMLYSNGCYIFIFSLICFYIYNSEESLGLIVPEPLIPLRYL